MKAHRSWWRPSLSREAPSRCEQWSSGKRLWIIICTCHHMYRLFTSMVDMTRWLDLVECEVAPVGSNFIPQELTRQRPVVQRWANSVLMTEYEYEYYSASQKWPNTNTNIIRFPKNDRIRIRILFGFPKRTEYEYEYYSVFQIWPNTNIIRIPKNT